ncbi:MAG TPA: discoidin domain-containing protein [Verrucomicrobiae bacterium]|nr:discoidin domain-containing protein [Verrucomicrobiae bacterium]
MRRTLFKAFILAFAMQAIADERPVTLAGTWRFQLDRSDAGIAQRWFERALPDRVKLPGDLSQQGIGDAPGLETKWIGGVQKPDWFKDPALAPYSKPGNFKFPYWLTPETHYAGAAWYQRDIEIPREWESQRVVLTLERPHWETRVWIDGRLIGTNNALGTPHEFDLGQVAPGKHTLTIRVDNRMIIDVGENSHSVSDHTQGNWNGIVGRLELRATPLVWIDEVGTVPQRTNRSVRVQGLLGNSSKKPGQGSVTLSVREKGHRRAIASAQVNATWTERGGSFEGELALGNSAEAWDEFNSKVYTVSASLNVSGALPDTPRHERETVVGFRDIGIDGTQFTINGRKLFFRGTLECAIFPKTGHPPTDLGSWKRIMDVCRAHGLNMIRFHSWCPPEAAFHAADDAGMYLQVECSSWANQSTTLGDGRPVDAWIYQEADRILKHYGNHPSFVLMLYGNEPGGPKQNEYLDKWVKHYRALDPRRLYSSGAGWPQIDANQFHVTPDPRIQLWGQGLKSRINGKPPETTTDYRDYINRRKVPVISHEIGQWCVYPNLDEIPKYTGYLKARNFEIFRASLEANHMLDQARDFLLASGKLQALCYKEDIEAALRTPGMGGFQLLDLHDFPGQGTALVGVLDPFWEEKGYISPDEYRRYCDSTVPLARLSRRVFTTEEALEADLEVAHFGAAPMQAVTRWKLVGQRQKVLASGALPARRINVDNAIALRRIRVPLDDVSGPQQCRLVVSIDGTIVTSEGARRRSERVSAENGWDLWVYPRHVNTEPASDIMIVEEMNRAALGALEAGGKVLLMIPPSRVKNADTNKVALGFSSIFWNTAWTHRQAPTTLGILCDPKHPALAEFPTDFHSNWQWWYLINRAGAMILDDMPAALRPTVQVIDDWVTNHRLALLFEAKVSGGNLMVCSVDLKNELETDPVRRQFRHSVLNYMSGSRFNPRVPLTPSQVRSLVSTAPEVKGLDVRAAESSSEETGYEASNAVDADPNTLWHTAWTPEPKRHPHELKIQFNSAREFSGVTILPRQDGPRNGWIREFVVYASNDGSIWGEPVAKGSFAQDAKLKSVSFDRTINAKFVRFVALSGFGSDPHASMAEFSLVDEGARAEMRDERGIPIRQVRGSVFEPAANQAIPITVDGRSGGLVFDGVGAVSAGGSSRLLIDYPEPQRSEILDYLFKPNYGAALQILKVEIGADSDTTAGAEPSHEREPGSINCGRGYEWWLIKEAKARNPAIKLAALAWGSAGWVNGGFWSDDNIQYTLNWLGCAALNGYRVDYLGGGNERGWDAEYYIRLAAALKQNGFGHVKVIASDDHNPPNYWSVATAMKNNPAFASAVDVVGQHDVCGWRTLQRHCSVSSDALELSKPLWDSENSTQDYLVGAEPLARVMTRHYLDAGVTANLNWALVSSMYSSFPCAGTGLMLADRPWSGYYDVGKIIWVDAHLTQFTEPGWRYLDSACGYSQGGASFTTLRSPVSGDYTMFIETLDQSRSETWDVSIEGGLSTHPVQLWSTAMRSADASRDFVHVGSIEPKNGRYQVKLEPGHVYTISTLTGQGKGDARPTASGVAQMPLPFREDFEAVDVGRFAKYFSDVHGAFEIAPASANHGGKVYRQVVSREPVIWHRTKMQPTTIVGDPRWWGDYEVSADALLEGKGSLALLGRVESQQHSAAGYHLQFADSGEWKLLSQDIRGVDTILASGTNNSFGVNKWHRLALRFEGATITATLDGAVMARVKDDSHTMGQVGFRVSPWQHAQFDNLRVVPTRPAPQLLARSEMKAVATSEHAMNDHGMIHIAANAIDDRLETTWRSEYSPIAPLPQSVTVDLGCEHAVQGLIHHPPIAGLSDAAGCITEYNVYLSADGSNFGKVASGRWRPGIAARTAAWPSASARFVRLEATASSSGSAVAVSELDVIASSSTGSSNTAQR